MTDVIKTLTAWPSSSVSPSSGVEEDGESDPEEKRERILTVPALKPTDIHIFRTRFLLNRDGFTSVQLLKDTLKPPLEGNGISWTLEGQAKLPLLHTPVMEDGVHLVVD